MIYLDQTSDQTICLCDRCGVTEATTRADGVVVDGWMTGHFFLDISLSEQRQKPLCFCPDCTPVMLDVVTIQVSAAPWEPAITAPPPKSPEDLLHEWRLSASLTRPRLLTGLVAEKWISEAEGDLWLIGTLPATVLALIDQMPPERRFEARSKALTATIIPRSDPLVVALGQLEGKTDEDLDQFFRNWALDNPVWPEPEFEPEDGEDA